MINKVILLILLLLPACWQKPSVKSTKSGVRGIARSRYLPNPVQEKGKPISVEPLVGKLVVVHSTTSDKARIASATSDGNGHFFIPLRPGEYRLALEPGDKSVVVMIEEGKQEEVVLETIIAPP